MPRTFTEHWLQNAAFLLDRLDVLLAAGTDRSTVEALKKEAAEYIKMAKVGVVS